MLSLRKTLCAVALTGLLVGPAAAKEVCYFGVCKDVPAAPAEPTPVSRPTSASGDTDGGPKVLASFGSWDVVDDGRGHRAIRDTFDDGSSLIVMKDGDGFAIVIREPTWHLHGGGTLAIKVDVDGNAFTGTASVVDGQTTALRHLTSEFVASLYHGAKARIEIGEDSWTIGLADAASAIDAAAKLGHGTTS